MVSYSFIASHLFLFPLFLSATAMTVPSLSLKNRAAPLIPRHSLSVSLSLSLSVSLRISQRPTSATATSVSAEEGTGSAVDADPIWTDRGCAETKPANRAGNGRGREREGRPRSASIRRPHFSALARNCEKIMTGRARSAPLSDGWTVRRTKLGLGSLPKLQWRDKTRAGRTSISGRSENLCGSSAGSPAEGNTFITFRIIIFSVDLDAR